MAEYIDREAAIEALGECVRAYPTSYYNGIEVALTAIKKLPTADVREVVRGKWIRPVIDGKAVLTTMCSNCGYINNSAGEFHFCPNCGAVMREVTP